MKTVITGGHLSPAFAVIEKLRKEDVLFIGRKHALTADHALSLEYQLCQSLGISFKEVSLAKLQRKSPARTLLSLSKLPIGTLQAIKILKDFKPSVVLGFGGHVSLPVIFAAKILKIPVVIHEQTLGAGVANKIAGKLADKICISWLLTKKFFPKSKVIFTGNPIREEIKPVGTRNNGFVFKDSSRPIIYITGGSLGSHAINVLVEKSLESLLSIANIIHQTGDSKKYLDFDRLSKTSSEGYIVRKFLSVNELSDIYKMADLVVSRSGINTITELIYFQKPSFLIPLSIGQKNEQLKNAIFCKDLGLSEIAIQNKLTPEKFTKIIQHILLNLAKYKPKKSLEGLIKKDAAERIIKVLKNATRSKSS